MIQPSREVFLLIMLVGSRRPEDLPPLLYGESCSTLRPRLHHCVPGMSCLGGGEEEGRRREGGGGRGEGGGGRRGGGEGRGGEGRGEGGGGGGG